MKAIIFNSGLGNRMGEFTKQNHKSMAMLKNGETILERQLRILAECGLRDFIITTGPFKEQLEQVCSKEQFSHLNFNFVNNPIYDKTNYIYSMYLAREHFNDDALILHGDLVFDKKLIEEILKCDYKSLATASMSKPLPKKDFKARIIAGNIREVSVNIFDSNCFAFQPLYKLSKDKLKAWTKKVEEYINAGNDKVYAENALNELLMDLEIKAFEYESFYIDEVDNLEDLARVSEEIRQFDFDEQEIMTDTGDYIKIPEILKKNRAKKPMLVCDKIFDKLFISDYFNNLNIELVKFSDFSPNPLYQEVERGVQLFKKENCDFIISVGGGSAIDTAKNIKLFSALDSSKNYLDQEFVYNPVKHIAMPTTAGTGSESTRFSVLYYNGKKQSISHDTIVPEYVFLEPKFLETLPEYQKKSTMLDAMCQCIEAIWSVNTNEKCRGYAQTGLQLIIDNILLYLKGDRESFKKMMKAANLSGKAINISQTTAAHAMSYELTSMYGISHGHAVSLCLPEVWRFMLDNMDKKAPGITDAHIRDALNIYKTVFGINTANDLDVLEQFEFMLNLIGLDTPELKDKADIEVLTDSVNPIRLGNNPIVLSRDSIRELYEMIFGLNDSGRKKNENNKQELRELQQLELEILLKVDEFCKKHNITYYLGEGTLLGAIRHGGFIPWDDDVDILMPRDDYDRFIMLAQQDFPAGYNLDSFETNPKHWVLGAKIQMTRKTKFTQEKMSKVAMYNGPYIDIFPLDYVPKRYSNAQRIQMRVVRFLRRFLFIKTGYSLVMNKKPHRYAMWILSKVVSTNILVKLIDRQMRKFNNRPRKFMINLCSYHPLSRQVFPVSYFKERFESFEGHMLPVPSEAEYMLKTIYGKNYMDLPSNRVRKGRNHDFTIDRSFVEEPAKNELKNSGNIRVSVIVPVYNVEEYLPRCLDSLVNQTLQNIEIIVINDGSPDNSQAIIDDYKKKYPHIIKAYQKENTGVADTRNFGISKASGDYIGFVDSDDYISLDMYEKMVKKADETGSQVVVCRYKRFLKSGNASIPNVIDKNAFGSSVQERPQIILGSRPYLANKIFQRKLITENNIKMPLLRLCEDSAMTYPLLLLANKVELVDEPLYFYQVDREDSSVNTYDDRLYDAFKSWDIIIDFYKNKGCFKSCYYALAEQCRIIISVRLRALNWVTDKRFINDYIKQSFKYLNKNFKGWRKNKYFKYYNKFKKKPYSRFRYKYSFALKAFYCLPQKLRDPKLGKSLTKRVKNIIKDSGIGSFISWQFSDKNRMAKSFAYYYEKGNLLDDHVFYCAARGGNFNGNPYAIFKYLYENPDFKHLKHVILINDKQNPRVKPYLNDDRVIVIKTTDYKNYARYAQTCKYLIVDSSLISYYIKKEGQVYVHSWHSTLLKSLGAHTDLIWETHNLAKSLLDSDFFFSPNRYTSERLFKAYYCDTLYKGKIFELGYPRNDLMYHADKQKIRESLNIPDNKKVVLYAPTWRGTVSKPVKNMDIFFKHYDRISSGLGDEYTLLIKLHIMSEECLTDEQMKRVVPFDIETNMLLSITDILITDYSGILFDYLITGNPLILFPFDEAEYLNHRGGEIDFYLDLNEIPAPICRTSESVVQTINNIDNIAQEKMAEYNSFKNRFVGNDDGHASERACDAIFCNKYESGFTLTNNTNDKKSILIIFDDLSDLTITSKFLNFLDKVDYDKYQISIYLKSIHENRQMQKKINRNAKIFYKSVRPICLNFTEWRAIKRISSCGMDDESLIKLTNKLFKRNMRRNFADISFDTAIYYTGKSAYYSLLCLLGVEAKKKVAYCHNPNTKAFSTYKYYDEIVVSPKNEKIASQIDKEIIDVKTFEERFFKTTP
ncbi:MAG: iron-containing alcohol dehydrogenase [Oscillospiraceae bacterium]|nr:iron-containing alcohol dehydrogenase [Oscillospiraceae bacterium]